MLEAALGKYGHFYSGNSLDPASHNLAFQCVELLYAVISQRNEGYAFRHLNDVRSRERAEPLEAVASRRSIAAHVSTAQPATVSERMLDAAHAPAFLIKHGVVNHAAD